MSARPQVLAVDDDPRVLDLLTTALGAFGYAVETARSGRECLERVTAETDLVLLDVDMPQLNGWATAAAMRADGRWADLPLLMVTGRDTREDRLFAVECGASDFIGKPVDVAELRVRTGSLLRLRAAQLANRRHQAQLEEMVSRRTLELVQARDEALAASRAKSAFLTRMSHELRTPLNGILGFSELLEEAAQERGDNDGAEMAQHIGRSAARLERLVSDVLEFAAVQASRSDLQISTFRLTDLLAQLVRSHQAVAERSGTRLQVAVPAEQAEITTDRPRLTRALAHLVHNACSFTRNGTVTLQAETTPRAGLQWLRLRVRDTGPGMTREQMSRSFDRFWQADDAYTREHEGAGLGIPVARHLCELLGGGLSAASQPGEGCLFTAEVPALPAT